MGSASVYGMSRETLANHKSSKRGPGQVETDKAGTIFPVKKGGLKKETPVETFGFGLRSKRWDSTRRLVPGGRGGFHRLRLMPPTQVAFGLCPGSVWAPSGLCLGSVRAPSGLRLDSVWTPSGLRLDSVWTPSGLRLGSVWAPSGLRPGSVWAPSWLRRQIQAGLGRSQNHGSW